MVNKLRGKTKAAPAPSSSSTELSWTPPSRAKGIRPPPAPHHRSPHTPPRRGPQRPGRPAPGDKGTRQEQQPHTLSAPQGRGPRRAGPAQLPPASAAAVAGGWRGGGGGRTAPAPAPHDDSALRPGEPPGEVQSDRVAPLPAAGTGWRPARGRPPSSRTRPSASPSSRGGRRAAHPPQPASED